LLRENKNAKCWSCAPLVQNVEIQELNFQWLSKPTPQFKNKLHASTCEENQAQIGKD